MRAMGVAVGGMGWVWAMGVAVGGMGVGLGNGCGRAWEKAVSTAEDHASRSLLDALDDRRSIPFVFV